ncbi:hypothetical protein HK405_010706, partial [Cladochytrium tenue]
MPSQEEAVGLGAVSVNDSVPTPSAVANPAASPSLSAFTGFKPDSASALAAAEDNAVAAAAALSTLPPRLLSPPSVGSPTGLTLRALPRRHAWVAAGDGADHALPHVPTPLSSSSSSDSYNHIPASHIVDGASTSGDCAAEAAAAGTSADVLDVVDDGDVAHDDDEEHEEEEDAANGWRVVAGAASMMFVTLGLVYSFGVVQAELIARGFASASALGWASSLSLSLMPLLAVPCNTAVRRTGHRSTALAGAVLLSAGFLALSWAVGGDDGSGGSLAGLF